MHKVNTDKAEAAAEKARQEAIRPDKDKLIDFANKLLATQPLEPILKSPFAKDLLAQTVLDLQDTAATLKERAEEL